MTGRLRVLPAALLALVGCAGFGARQNPSSSKTPAESAHTFVYVAGPAGEVEVLELDLGAGALTRRGKLALGAPIRSLAGPARGRLLLAAMDTPGGKGASVVSLAADPRAGILTSLSRAVLGGTEPMGAAVDVSGRYVAVANHGSGNVSILPIRNDGRLADADTFAAGRGASAVGFHPSNTVAFVVNEEAGTISQYSFNPGTGALTPKPGPPLGLPWDSHPRQIRCHPNGRFVYVLNETNQNISVHSFDDRLGTLNRMAFQVVPTLPEGVSPGGQNRAGSMRIAPSGTLLYATNRGHDSVVVFGLDPEVGEITLRAHVGSRGQDPIELVVEPGGKFLIVANQKSRNLAVFRIGEGGDLDPAGSVTLAAAPLTVHVLRPPLKEADAQPTRQALLP